MIVEKLFKSTFDINYSPRTISHTTSESVYNIPCYVTMDNGKWYTSRAPFDTCEEIRAIELQNHVNDMLVSRFRYDVELYFLLHVTCKSNLDEALLFQVILPLLEHFVE